MLTGWIKRFWDDRRGYVIALTLIAMPLLLGFSLLVIDAGRGDNLHTDLQNAVDALALTGARELDGRDDAIPRAKAAMEKLANSATFTGGGSGMSLGGSITVKYVSGDEGASTVIVHFLKSIPANDDDPIDLDTMETTSSNEASYAWVIAKPQAMNTIFPIPVGLNRDTVDIGAEAVAVYQASACDVTPIYICNPFETSLGPYNESENEQATAELHDKFAAGDLYGTQIELHNTGSSSPGPGNFGFLETYAPGGQVLAEALATGSPGVCYKQNGLQVKTGATTGPVASGLNTRFGIYGGGFNSNSGDPRYRPAENVRMAQDQSKPGQICSSYNPVLASDGTTVGDPTKAVPLGYGAVMGNIGTGSGKISASNDWNIQTYWSVAHGDTAPTTQTILQSSSTYPSSSSSPSQPSAYDVYQYELANPSLIVTASPDGETGTPPTGGQCYNGPAISNYPTSEYGDRRVIFAAVINCGYESSTGALTGSSGTVNAAAFARVFLTKPAITNINSGDRYVSFEVIDITGRGGRGTLDEFLREESELVR